jgi:LytS/YehU family sensor histidine kinase
MNVSQRLKLCFGPSAGIKIERTEDGTAVHFRVPARRKPDSEAVCAS